MAETAQAFGPNYIIPVPFDPRLIRDIPPRRGAKQQWTQVAGKPIVDMEGYKNRLSARLDPTASTLQVIMDKVRKSRKSLIFAEGEQEAVIRAAIAYKDGGLGEPVLIRREELCAKICSMRAWVSVTI